VTLGRISSPRLAELQRRVAGECCFFPLCMSLDVDLFATGRAGTSVEPFLLPLKAEHLPSPGSAKRTTA